MVKKGSIISIKGISFDLLFFFHYFVTKRLNANIMKGKSRQEEILHLDERNISSQARTFFIVKYTKQEYSEEEMKVLSSIHSFGFYSIVYIIKGTGECRIDNDVLDLAGASAELCQATNLILLNSDFFGNRSIANENNPVVYIR